MANKILAPIFNWFGYSIFATSRLQKRIQSTSQFDDVGARAASKKCGSTQAFGKKRKAIQRGYSSHK